MPRTKKVQSPEEYENTQRIIRNQDLFNDTGDCQYLWKMKPDLEHAIRSLLIKMSGNYIYPGLYEKADYLSLCWMEYYKYRRDKGNPLCSRAPICYARYMILLYDTKAPPDRDLVELDAADWYKSEYDEDIDEESDEEYILPNGKSLTLKELEDELM